MSTLHQIRDGLLDLVFPRRCLICGAAGGPVLCAGCERGFLCVPAPTCLRCGRPLDSCRAPCRLCAVADELWGGWAFSSARAAGVFQGPLRLGVHRLKYRGGVALAAPLGALLANRLVAESETPPAVDAVVAVPLHRARERRRGYNQAWLLAEPVAAQLGVPLLPADTVAKNVATAAQVRLSPTQRRRNVGPTQFGVAHPERVRDRRLLLIDDVFTTGATVHAVAAALRAAGARRVDVATLAAGG